MVELSYVTEMAKPNMYNIQFYLDNFQALNINKFQVRGFAPIGMIPWLR
jgi:hypothetical protein